MKLLDTIKECGYKAHGEYNFIMLQCKVVAINTDSKGVEYLEVQQYLGNGEYDNNIINVYHANKSKTGKVLAIPSRIIVGAHVIFQGTLALGKNSTFVYFKRNWVRSDVRDKAESFCFLAGYLREYNGEYRIYQGEKFYKLNLTHKQKVLFEIYFSVDNSNTKMAVFADFYNNQLNVDNINLLSKIKVREPKINSEEQVAIG